MLMDFKISIIIAVYNGAKTLENCLKSIQKQSYSNIEIIIMDGGSSDDTLTIIRSYEELITHWESEKDDGHTYAWNKALDFITGDWVYFLGADDYFYADNTLSKVAEKLQQLPPEIKLAYGQIMMVDEIGESLYVMGVPWEQAKQRFFIENTLPHQALFHHSDLFTTRRFDNSFLVAGDYELLLWAISHGHEPFFLKNLMIANTQQGGLSNTPSTAYKTILEFAKTRELHGYSRYSLPFFYILFKAYIKKALFHLKVL